MNQNLLHPLPSLSVFSPFSAALSICDSEWLAMRTLSERVNGVAIPLVYIQNIDPRVDVGVGLEGRSWSAGSGYQYGFQAQEQDAELWDGAVNYKYRVEDPRLGRFFSVDPLNADYPYYTTYQFSGNRLIDMIELEGLEPAISGKEYGDIQQAEVQDHSDWGNRSWMWDGSGWGSSAAEKVVEIISPKSCADPAWKSFITDLGPEGYENYCSKLYESKLAPYLIPKGLNVGLFGLASDGTVNVPFEFKSKLMGDVQNEAMPILKAAWAADKSGIDPTSLNFTFNLLARAHYKYWRGLAVSSREEGFSLVNETGIEVATAWALHMVSSGQSISINKYPNSQGGGLNLYINGERSIGLDWHKFKVGGKKTGSFVNRPHLDIPGAGLKHFPWHQIDKYKRGVN